MFGSAFCRYLDNVDGISMPQDQVWYCTLTITIMLMSSMCSTLFIINMTFERFYSIIRPHKAASFNTVKRAKITIMCIIIFGISYNIPHIFLSSSVSRQCVPYGKAMKYVYGQVYYWFSFTISFALPFVLLLLMNCVIIHTLRKRSSVIEKVARKGQGQNQGEGQAPRMQSAERQIYITLLLVTFAFLILLTPAYVFYLYQMFYDYHKSPRDFAVFYLYNSISQKTIYTNNGINFFLYVISGQKFRSDLASLFKCNHGKIREDDPTNGSTMTSTRTLNDVDVA